MNILVISRSPWRNDNSFGNTYSNIFDGMKDVSIANIFLADGAPDGENTVVEEYFQVSESEMIKSLTHIGRKVLVGGSVHVQKSNRSSKGCSESKQITVAKKRRWSIFFIAREMIWKYGRINTEQLLSFVNDFNPDIIFLPFYYAKYVDRVAILLQERFNIPMVLEASIDIYTLKQLSFDPFFWINRFLIRQMIRKTVKHSEKLYVISEKMKEEYEKILRIKCGVLYKFPDTSRLTRAYKNKNEKIVYLYTGNIGNGRWKTLGKLGEMIFKHNAGKMVIYTPTVVSEKMKKALEYCEVKPPVSQSRVVELQNDADVLVHAESFGLKDRLEVRYSISTKIMDYISCGRCILAIGPKGIASIDFLSENELALVCCSEEEIEKVVEQICEQPGLVNHYAENTLAFKHNFPTREEQQKALRDDLESIVLNYRNSGMVSHNNIIEKE